ncbi:MAG: desulfoferrodoxin [Desulfobacteraceae bacterium]|nr:desulfoferrodoxin [Desulfobacteraceae bacterium]
MAEKLGVYRCEKCGNIVEVLHGEEPSMSCCGQEMTLLAPNSVDAAREKHVPVVEKIEGGYLVKVGSVAHPMEEKHYIEWIELNADGMVLRKFLKPGDTPEARFFVDADTVTAREYCNLHGFWTS